VVKTTGFLFQAAPCVVIGEVNKQVKMAEIRPKKTGPVPLIYCRKDGSSSQVCKHQASQVCKQQT